MAAQQHSANSLTQMVGDCELVFRHPVSYEPPLYMFPELLAKVPEGTGPIAVGDAVSNALVVEASFLNIAELFHLPSEDLRKGAGRVKGEAADSDGDGDNTSPQDKTNAAPIVTLASLLASNRLHSIGLTAEALQRGQFSSGRIIEELLKLKTRAGLDDDEARALMSNHFINLLAWRAAVDINSQPLPAKRGRETGADVEGNDTGESVSCQKQQKRDCSSNEEGTDEIDPQMLRPSEDPWSSGEGLHPGTFVAAHEKDVEKRVEAIEALTRLYRRPWKTLQSKGIQTDRFRPAPINETAPYVDSSKLPGAYLDVTRDLGWSPEAHGDAQGCDWKLQVSSSTVSGCLTVPVQGRVMHFGRDAGVVCSVSGSITNVRFGFGSLTEHPELVSPHHFSLFVIPNKLSVPNIGEDSPDQGKEAPVSREDVNYTHSLWLLNYGRNGVRVDGKQWVLGNMHRLKVGSVICPTCDVRMVVTYGSEVAVPQEGSHEATGAEVDGMESRVVKSEPVASIEG